MVSKFITNKRYFLGMVLAALFFAGVSFFFEGRAVFGPTNNLFYTNYEFFFSFAALLILEIAIFYVAKRCFQIKAQWGLASFLGAFFLISSLAIIFYKGVSYNGNVIGQISWVYRIRYILLAFMLYLSMYQLIVIIPHFIKGHRLIRLIFLIAVVTGFVATIYSYIFENEFYSGLFNGTLNFDWYSVPKSYTSHKNVYALVLFFALAGEGLLEIERPHWWRWPIMLYFYVQQFFALSKTGIAMGSLFCLGMFLYSLIMSIKRKQPTKTAFLSSFVLILFVVFLVFYLNKSTDGPLSSISKFLHIFLNELFDLSKNALKGRLASIEVPFDAVKPHLFTLLFGFGYGNEYRALGCFSFGDPNAYSIIDNAWGLLIAQNGMFGIIYSACIWLFGLALIVRGFMRKSNYSFLCLLIYICLFGRTMTENDNQSYLDFAGVVYFVFAYLPLLVEEAKISVTYLTHDKPVAVKHRIAEPSLYLGRGFALTSLPSLILIALTRKAGYLMNISYFTSLLLRYGGILLFFVSPFVLGAVIYALHKKKKAIGIVSLLVYLLYVASIFVLPLLSSSVLMLIPELAILAIDLFILSMAGIYEKEYFSILIVLGNYVLFTIACGVTYFFFQRFASSVTLYSVIAIGLTYAMLWLFIFLMPRRPSFAAPFEDALVVREEKYTEYRENAEKRFDEKTERILGKSH